ncbi:MAG: hypothetical protein DRJ02_01770 [Bacteroidetes bacterium]|nr:MAG: hypothetical protein DRJ02_01770 [Bacteroidota bacterium]
MYKLTFVYFYQLSQKRNPNPRFVALSYVALTALFQFAFLLGLFKYILGFIVHRFDENYSLNKLYLIPFVLLWLFVFEIIYNKKRTKRILDSYIDKPKVTNLKNTFLVLLFMLVPLIIGIYLFNNG